MSEAVKIAELRSRLDKAMKRLQERTFDQVSSLPVDNETVIQKQQRFPVGSKVVIYAKELPNYNSRDLNGTVVSHNQTKETTVVKSTDKNDYGTHYEVNSYSLNPA
jgi:uncharacterized protein (DUF1919 family)